MQPCCTLLSISNRLLPCTVPPLLPGLTWYWRTLETARACSRTSRPSVDTSVVSTWWVPAFYNDPRWLLVEDCTDTDQHSHLCYMVAQKLGKDAQSASWRYMRQRPGGAWEHYWRYESPICEDQRTVCILRCDHCNMGKLLSGMGACLLHSVVVPCTESSRGACQTSELCRPRPGPTRFGVSGTRMQSTEAKRPLFVCRHGSATPIFLKSAVACDASSACTEQGGDPQIDEVAACTEKTLKA